MRVARPSSVRLGHAKRAGACEPLAEGFGVEVRLSHGCFVEEPYQGGLLVDPVDGEVDLVGRAAG